MPSLWRGVLDMVKGVEFPYDTCDMLAVATKYHGNIAAIAEHYKVSRDCIYRYLNKDPQGKKIIEHVRGYNTETQLDIAEHVLHYHLTNYKTNPGLAQRAAEKVIDYKGHTRGWVAKNKDDKMLNDEEIQKMKEFFGQLDSVRSDRNKAASNINDEAKS